MEKTARPVTITSLTRIYCLLTKPGIILGNGITTAGGFALASRGHFDILLFLAAVSGLSLIIASACVFNNYIDRELDEKMERTKKRALVTGMASLRGALLFAICLALAGTFVLAFFTNILTLTIALSGFFVYVILYSFSKYRSIHGTLIGSIAGAVPPVVGYCAVSNRIDLGACILFAIMALWQMPHFLAIAIYRLDDYAAASLPVLPIKKGMQKTKIQMLLYIIAFMMASFMLTVFDYTGYAYLVVVALLGSFWLWLSIRGLTSANDKMWARKMFLFSLVIVMSLCLMIPVSVV